MSRAALSAETQSSASYRKRTFKLALQKALSLPAPPSVNAPNAPMGIECGAELSFFSGTALQHGKAKQPSLFRPKKTMLGPPDRNE
jgi:hypothetical protein